MKRLFVLTALLAALPSACTSADAHEAVGETGQVSLLDTGEGLAPWAHEFEAPMDAGGVGRLDARPLAGGISNPLHLRDLAVHVESAGHLAAFEVDHAFVNDSDEVLEGTFRFTLPPGAIVTGLAMQIGDEMMEGEIVEREKARKIYQDIVDQMRDPAILEWEQGRTFKLRVFPIEARADKRIVLRYLAPLAADPTGGEGAYRLIYPTVAPENQPLIDHFSLTINDRKAIDRRDFEAGADLRVPLRAAAAMPNLLVEPGETHDVYALRVRPRWADMPLPKAHEGPRTRIVWLDSSRSALESWSLAVEAAMRLASDLGPRDEFVVVSADIFVGRHPERPTTPAPSSLRQLEDELRAIEADGASDFSAALNEIAGLVDGAKGRAEVIYIGDGTPTWGSTSPEQLDARVELALEGASFHALVLGKGGDASFMRTLVRRHAGRVMEPRGLGDLRRFTTFLRHADQIHSIHDARLLLEDGEAETPWGGEPITLFEGNEDYLYFRLPHGQAPPARARLRGLVAGAVYEQGLELGDARKVEGLRPLWAAAEIEALQRDTDNKDRVVALSEQHGVLSRYTAMLVLESEEAYQRHRIERRKAAEAAAARISGRDLETLGSNARLAPGDIQPGDPEIHIPAPRDARSVTAIFPFGETKIAHWDASLGQWSLRFLIDAATPSGRYEVRIRIVHADGTVELRTAEYTVDTAAPVMKLLLHPDPDEAGAYRVVAIQVSTEADRARTRERTALGDERAASQQPAMDARSVDAVMPDGQTLTLRLVEPGRFEKTWRPRAEVQWPATVRLSATDRALNVGHQRLELPSPTPTPASTLSAEL